MRQLIMPLVAVISSVTVASTAAAQTEAPAFRQPMAAVPLPLLLIGGGSARSDLVRGNFEIGNLGNALNDRVTDYVVPAGHVMVMYSDSQFRGDTALVYGTGKVTGALAGKVSSIRVRPYNPNECAVAYEHANYAGAAWPFCRVNSVYVATDAAAYRNNISSVEVPRGFKLSFCTDDAHNPCRSYFQSTYYVGHASNDRFSSGFLSPFDENKFQMLFMSDPQFGWNGTKTDELAKYSDRFSSWKDAATAQSVMMTGMRTPFANPSYAGMVVNGDITNTADDWQLDEFSEIFGQRYDNIYPGLGNHDIDNYIKSSDNEYMLEWYDAHVSGTPGLVSYDIEGEIGRDGSRDAYRGSLAYSWDIGDVHFVQLNNYPSFAFKGDYDVDMDIRKSLDWLENDLKTRGNGKRIIINMHTLGASGFDAQGCDAPCAPGTEGVSERARSSNTAADYQRFQSILTDARNNHAKDQTVVVFGGHIHYWAGFDRSYKNMGAPTTRGTSNYVTTGVPMLFTGGAQYSVHLALEFSPGMIRVQTIDSSNVATDPLSVFSPQVVDTVEITSGGTVTRR